MTKIIFLSAFALSLACCKNQKQMETTAVEVDIPKEKITIASMLDSFNVAAANADYQKYFDYYTETATFNGTDATENWDKKAFMAWAKPFFDKKTTWNFTALKRNIYFGKHNDIAWFEELLNTQMKICRGSGVVVKQEGKWKVAQYVLSTTIPNDNLDAILTIKSPIEDSLIKVLQK